MHSLSNMCAFAREKMCIGVHIGEEFVLVHESSWCVCAGSQGEKT